MRVRSSIIDFLRKSPAAAQGLVLAVSGGADSIALLRAMGELQSAGAVSHLVVAHLNHLLRGDESDGDEHFVRATFAAVLDHSANCLEVERLPMAALADGDNLEAVARRERYRWLASVARRHAIAFVATGHTANDQAETVLHRMIRGAGLQGLRGIARRRLLEPGVELVRPMLDVTRMEVELFLGGLGQVHREDSSNAIRALTRNRIRHGLLPFLQQASQGVMVRLLCEVADTAEYSYRHTSTHAEALLVRCERAPAGFVRILDSAALNAGSPALAREALRLLWQREGWPRDRMRSRDWDRLLALARGEASALDLAGGVRARRRGAVIQIGPAS